jgi:predicted Fe-Mo cluster-binding NifX family protein
MKIAVTSSGNDLSSPIDPRFGRCANFIIVDSDSMEFQVVENSQNFNLPQGAGIQAGTTIANSRAEVLITGNCGPKAFMVLEQAGISVITGAGGTVGQVVEQFKNGELLNATQANVEGHWV